MRLSPSIGVETSGSTVLAWRDVNGHDALGTLANGPAYVADGINGRPVLRFSTGKSLQIANPVRPTVSAEYLAVVRLAAAPGVSNRWLSFGTSDAWLPFSNGKNYEAFGSSVNFELAYVSTNAIPILYQARAVANQHLTVWINGLQVGQRTIGALSWRTPAVIGALSGTSFSGDLGEIRFFDRALDEFERVSETAALAREYGLASVPTAIVQALNAKAEGGTLVSLEWSYSDSTSTAALIERSTDQANWSPLGYATGERCWVDRTATSATSYWYRVTPATLAGLGGSAAMVAITTPAVGLGDNLKLWLRADTRRISEGAEVARWTNLATGVSDAIQQGVGSRPVVDDGISPIGGRPVVRFSDGKSLTMAGGMPGVTAAAELFVVGRVTPQAGAGNLWLTFGTNHSWLPYSDGRLFDSFGLANQLTARNPVISGVPFLYHAAVVAGQSLTVRVDGKLTQTYPTNQQTLTWNTQLVLGQYFSSYNFRGDLAEVRVYGCSLTDAEREAVSSELATRFNLAAVPIERPVATAAAKGTTRVLIEWLYAGSDATGFDVERSVTGDAWTLVGKALAPDRALVDATATAGGSYTYRVIARSIAGPGPVSDPTATITTPSTLQANDALRIWLRADMGIGNEVTELGRWKDQTGRGNDAWNASLGGRPSVTNDTASGIGGHPVVHFSDGQRLNITSPTPMAGVTSAELFAVGRVTPQAGAGNLWLTFGTNHSWLPYSDGRLFDSFGLANQLTARNPVISGVPFLYHAAVVAGQSLTVRVDGRLTQTYPTTQATLTWSAPLVFGQNFGSQHFGGYNFRGDLAEVRVYGRSLTEAEREEVSSDLATRFKLASVPIQQPVATATTKGSTRVLIEWEYAGSDATAFDVERSITGDAWTLVGKALAPDRGLVDSTVTAGGSYKYRVIGRSIAGPGPASDPTTTVTVPSTPQANDALRIWLRADMGIGNEVNEIGRWIDQSGRGNDAWNASLGGRPSFSNDATFAIGDRPVVHFGDGQRLNITASTPMAGVTSAELFAVGRVTPQVGVLNMWLTFGTSHSWLPHSNGQLYDSFGLSSQLVARNPVISGAPFLYHASVVAGQSLVVSVNGKTVQTYPTTQSTLTWSAPLVLGQNFSSYNFRGDLAEVRVYGRSLTDAEREEVSSDLATRFKLAAVPIQQPVATATAKGSTRVLIEWEYAGSDATAFDVERSITGDAWTLVGKALAPDRALVDATATAGGSYAYRVIPRSIAGPGPASDPTATITTPGTQQANDALRIWLRADMGITNEVSELGRWKDQSSRGNDAWNTGLGSRPSVTSDTSLTIGGRPVVHFTDGQRLNITAPTPMAGVTSADLFAVGRVTPLPNTQNRWLSFGTISSFLPYSNGTSYESFGLSSQYNNPSPVITGIPFIYQATVIAGHSLTIRVNGALKHIMQTSQSPLTWSSPLILGTNGANFRGDLAEVRVYGRSLGSQECAALISELQWRYTSLPTPTVMAGQSSAIIQAGPHMGRLRVQRRLSNAAEDGWSTVAELTSTERFVDFNLTPDTAYEYRCAVEQAGALKTGPVASTRTLPGAPSLRRVTLINNSQRVAEGLHPVTLSLNAVVSGAGTASGFRVTGASSAWPGGIAVGGGSGNFVAGDGVLLHGIGTGMVAMASAGAGGWDLLLVDAAGKTLAQPPVNTAMTIDNRSASPRWTWYPDHVTAIPWGHGDAVRRVLVGTASDIWARNAGVFTDTWGRPSGSYTVVGSIDVGGTVYQDRIAITVMRGEPPMARIDRVTDGSPGGAPPVFLSGATSDDDHGIVDAWWDVDVAVDSDADGIPGNDRDAQGLAVSWSYATVGVRTVQLTVVDGAGQASKATASVTVRTDAPVQAAIIPFEGDVRRPIPAIPGRPVPLHARAWASGNVAVSWSFGDGAPTPSTDLAVQTNVDPRRIAAQHVFTGAIGTSYQVTCTVRDASGRSVTVQRTVSLVADDAEGRADQAILRGLWYLHQGQTQQTDDARWSSQYASETASCLQAFSLHGHLLTGDPLADPYVETVRRAHRWMLRRLQPVAGYTAPITGDAGWATEQLVDANNTAIEAIGAYAPYQLGMVMDALASSGSLTWTAMDGHALIKGRRTIDLMRDAADTYVWGQGSGSSWRYSWRSDGDNSAAQWAAIGGLAAEQEAGTHMPAVTKSRLLQWMTSTFRQTYYNYDGNSSSEANSATTPSAMVQLAWCGVPRSDARWRPCEAYIRGIWSGYNYRPGANPYGRPGRPDLYCLYAFVKAMRLAQPTPVELLDDFFDWYGDPTDGIRVRLVNAQESDGGWQDMHRLTNDAGHSGENLRAMATAWSVIILSPSLFSHQRSELYNHAPVVRARDVEIDAAPGLASAQVAVSAVDAGSSDLDGDSLTGSLVPQGPFPVGVTLARLVMTDPLGARGEADVRITVVDREAPILSGLPVLVLSTSPGKATASRADLRRPAAGDNVGVVTVGNDAPELLPLGRTVVTWTASDAAGNRATRTQAVDVVDREPPVVTPPGAIVVWIGEASSTVVTLGTATAIDQIGVTAIANDAPATFQVGVTSVVWTAQDAAGNRGFATQLVDVRAGLAAPELRLTSPGPGTAFQTGASIHLTAEPWFANPGDVLRVDFLVDGQVVGSSTTPPYRTVWPNAPQGTHRIAAVAIFDRAGHPELPDQVEAIHREISIVNEATVPGVLP